MPERFALALCGSSSLTGPAWPRRHASLHEPHVCMMCSAARLRLPLALELRGSSVRPGPKEEPNDAQLFSKDPPHVARAVRVLMPRDGRPRGVGGVVLAPSRAAEADPLHGRPLRHLGR